MRESNDVLWRATRQQKNQGKTGDVAAHINSVTEIIGKGESRATQSPGNVATVASSRTWRGSRIHSLWDPIITLDHSVFYVPYFLSVEFLY